MTPRTLCWPLSPSRRVSSETPADSTQMPDAVAAWVDDRIRGRRHEPLVLAASLSEVAAERLLATACDSGEHELLIAAGAAVRQHARFLARSATGPRPLTPPKSPHDRR